MGEPKSQKKAKSQLDDSTSFEAAFSKLEETLSQLEEGNLGLAEALAQYEQGVKFLKHCYNLLERTERKIEQLTGVDAQGSPITEPFEHESAQILGTAERQRKRGAERSTKAPNEAEDFAGDDVDAGRRLF